MTTTKTNTPNYELLKDAYAIIDGIPARLIDLDAVVTKQGPSLDCGTICCAAGWLALHPQFQALGLAVDPTCSWHQLSWRGKDDFYDEVMAKVFDLPVDTADWLFGAVGNPGHDDYIPARKKRSHKQLFLARVRMYLRYEGQL